MKNFEEIMAVTGMSEAELGQALLQHFISKAFESSYSIISAEICKQVSSFAKDNVAKSFTVPAIPRPKVEEQKLSDNELSSLSKAFDLSF